VGDGDLTGFIGVPDRAAMVLDARKVALAAAVRVHATGAISARAVPEQAAEYERWLLREPERDGS
jgi:hypothetical protein